MDRLIDELSVTIPNQDYQANVRRSQGDKKMMDEHVQETELNSWIGRIRTVYDDITAFPINALSGLLDRQDPIAGKGTVVPPLWHWLFFLPIHRTHETRRDGHVNGGEFMPPIALPRRVWAGSKFIWQASNPLSVGESATRISRIASITSKEGKSGELVFVRQVHEFHNAAGLSFINEHLTAYRGATKPGVPQSNPVAAETGAAWHREITPDAVLLFRYSALMFNSHRIHYDWPYATREEGYPALLVQGPLIATLLMDLLRRNAPDAIVRSLEFRAVRPSFVDRTMHLRGQPEGDQIRLWASDDEGQLAMTARAEVESW